jgi:thiol:disulfide interchange protein
MEIEPEVLPKQESAGGNTRQRPPLPRAGSWQMILSNVLGLVVLGVILFLAFWFVLVIIGIGLVLWAIRKVTELFTGKKSSSSSSSIQFYVRRPPGD